MTADFLCGALRSLSALANWWRGANRCWSETAAVAPSEVQPAAAAVAGVVVAAVAVPAGGAMAGVVAAGEAVVAAARYAGVEVAGVFQSTDVYSLQREVRR